MLLKRGSVSQLNSSMWQGFEPAVWLYGRILILHVTSQLDQTWEFCGTGSFKFERLLYEQCQNTISTAQKLAGWWFQTCFIFHTIWDVILPID